MTDSNTQEVNFDAPERKAPAPSSIAPYAGLTRTQCASACNADSCAISQRAYCAHPNKGGLQPSQMRDAAALARMDAARAELERDDLEAKISKRAVA